MFMVTITDELHIIPGHIWSNYGHHGQYTSHVKAELIRDPQAMSRATCEIRQKLGQGRVTITNADLVGGLPYLRMIIKETLRLRPAAPLM